MNNWKYKKKKFTYSFKYNRRDTLSLILIIFYKIIGFINVNSWIHISDMFQSYQLVYYDNNYYHIISHIELQTMTKGIDLLSQSN